jgi:hypothetical protein
MDTSDIQYRARQLTEDIAVALQAKLLLEAGNAAVSDALSPAVWAAAGGSMAHCRAGWMSRRWSPGDAGPSSGKRGPRLWEGLPRRFGVFAWQRRQDECLHVRRQEA